MLFFDLVLLAFLALLAIHPNFFSTLGNSSSNNNSKQHQNRMIQFIAMILLALRIIVFVTVTAVGTILNSNDAVALLKSYTTKSSSSTAVTTTIKKPLTNGAVNNDNSNNVFVSLDLQKQKQPQEEKQKQKQPSAQGPASYCAASSLSSSLIIDTHQSVTLKDTMKAKNDELDDKTVETKTLRKTNDQQSSSTIEEKGKQQLPIEEENKNIGPSVIAQHEKEITPEKPKQLTAVTESPKKAQEQGKKFISPTATSEGIDAVTTSLAVGKEESLLIHDTDSEDKDNSNDYQKEPPSAPSEEVSLDTKNEGAPVIHLQQKSNNDAKPEELPNQPCGSVHSKNSSQIDSSEEHSSDDTALTSDASETSFQPPHPTPTTTTQPELLQQQQRQEKQKQKQETEKPEEEKSEPVEKMQSQQHPLKKQPSLMTLEYNPPVTATSSVHSTSTTSQNTSLLARMAGKAKSNNSREDSEKKPLPKSGILPIRTCSLRLGRRSNGNIRQETKTVDDKNGPGASTVHRTLSMKLPKGAGSIFSSNKSHETDNSNTPTKTKSTPRQFFASLGRRSKVPDSPRKEQNQIPPQMQSVQPNDSNSNSSTLKKTRLKSKRLSTFFH